MADTYVPPGYVSPNPVIESEIPFQTLSPAELSEIQAKANPHGIRTVNLILHKPFKIEELRTTGLQINLEKEAQRIFADPFDQKIGENVSKLNKDPAIFANVPEKILVLGASHVLLNGDLPFSTEGTVRGLAPTVRTNKNSLSYRGSHFFIPKKCNTSDETQIHETPKNLRLKDAIEIHGLTEKDFDDHVKGQFMYDGQLCAIVTAGPENPLSKVFASQKGVAYIKNVVPDPVNKVQLVPNDPNSPYVTVVPIKAINKAKSAVGKAKIRAQGHVQSIKTSEFGVDIIPASPDVDDFTNIDQHPYFKGMDPEVKAHKMNKYREMTIGLKISFIPVKGN